MLGIIFLREPFSFRKKVLALVRNLNRRTATLSLALLVSIDSFNSLIPPLAALASLT